MIKAIFFDLDGTLLSHTTRCIPQDTLQALRKLRDKGIRIYINYVDDTVRKAQRSISTPVPEIGTYENGKIYQATAFLTRQEETGFEKYIPDGCRFARWCDNGADIISDQGGKAEGIKYFCNLYGIWIIILEAGIFVAYRVEKEKRKFDTQTFREIQAFLEGKSLSEIEKDREKGKRLHQKVFLAIGAGVIALAVSLFFLWILGVKPS